MRGSVSGGFLLLLALCCSFAHAYIYNYCQAPLPRYYAPPIGSLNLVQVSVITRHGDRSPAVVLPAEGVEWVCGATDDLEIEADGLPTVGPVYRNIFIDPSSPFSSNLWSGNCTVGQLTSKGATQHYLLGQQLRSIYISTLRFIPPTFDPTLLFIRSTDVWRTQQSAEANLLGLYPVSTRNGIVPMVNITPSNIENMFGNLGACPILVEAATNLTQQPEYLTHLDAFEPVLTKLNTICNTTDYYGANSSWTTLDFWDNLQARTCHNLPLPCSGGVCVNKTDMAALLKEGNFEFTWLNSGPYLTRLGIGLFVTEVLNHISSVLNGTSSQRYAYYSGHDSTLAPWLNAWNITDWQWPPYASNLLMETWQSKDGANVYVRMIYNGDLVSFPYCSNPQFCTWAEITNYYEEHIKADVSLCF